MRKKVVVGIVSVLSLSGVAAVCGGGSWAKSRVLGWVTDQLDNNIDADVVVGSASASLVTSFPSVGVHLHDVTITGRGDFEGTELLRAGELSLYVDLPATLAGNTIIDSVSLRDAVVTIRTNADGRLNTDIVAPSDDTPDGETQLRLNHIALETVDFRYLDEAGGIDLAALGIDHTSTGAISGDLASLSTVTEIEAFTAEAGGVHWLSDVHTGLTGDVSYDFATGGLRFADANLSLNALVIGLEGGFVPSGPDYDVDLSFATTDTSFKTLLSVLPSAYTADFADVDATGTFALGGTAKGRYATEEDDLPAFDFTLDVPEATVRYPSLASPIEGIKVRTVVTHPQGPTDAIAVNVEAFEFSVEGHALSGSLGLTHIDTDPDIDLKAKGRLDLDALSRAWPLEGADYGGGMDLDVELRGRLSAFEASRAQDLTARGSIIVKGMTYTSATLADAMHIDELGVRFTPQHAEVSSFAFRTGSTDVRGTGFMDHPLAYALGKGPLTGQFSMRGQRLDLDELSGGEETDTTADDGVLVTVPTDLDLTFASRFDHLVANGMEVENMRGSLIIRDGAVFMQNVQVDTLGGRVELNGSYSAPTAESAAIDLQIAAIDLDLKRTFERFTTLQKLLPAAVGANGLFDSGIQMNAKLGPDGSLDLGSLASDGSVFTRGVRLAPGSLAKLAETLGDAKFGSLDLDGAKFLFTMVDGNLVLKPAAVRVGGAPATLQGGVGMLAQTLDLTFDVKLPTKALAGSSLLGGAPLPVGDTTNLLVGLTGDWADPKLSTSLGEVVKEAVIGAATEAAAEVAGDLVGAASARGDALIAAAKTQADEVRRAAGVAAAKVRKDAKIAGDKLVAEASNPIAKKAAEKAAATLRTKADQKAGQIESEADRKATGLVEAAETKKAALVAEAGG